MVSQTLIDLDAVGGPTCPRTGGDVDWSKPPEATGRRWTGNRRRLRGRLLDAAGYGNDGESDVHVRLRLSSDTLGMRFVTDHLRGHTQHGEAPTLIHACGYQSRARHAVG